MNKEWFIFKSTHHLGPFSIKEMDEFYRAEEINEQTLVWREGASEWRPISKEETFKFLFTEGGLPPLPNIPSLPTIPDELRNYHLNKAPSESEEAIDDDLPPPIPLDAILDPKGVAPLKMNKPKGRFGAPRLSLMVAGLVFIGVIAWYALTQRDANIQLRVKGLMPAYLEKLEANALLKNQRFEVALALSLDSLTLWGSTNYPGDIDVNIELNSIPKRVLGTEDITVKVKGKFNNHLGKFTRMALTKGSKFLPGEYNVHVSAKETHVLNHYFKEVSDSLVLDSLNKTYNYDGTTLIYPGTPREFEKRLMDYSTTMITELLKPFQDKLERIQTFESILNQTSQNYIMDLQKAKNGKSILLFESKFIKEISPLLQALVVKAQELAKDPKLAEQESSSLVVAPYREQVLLGKQIGEMASDMITKTQSYKNLTDKDKAALEKEFSERAKSIKFQIDMNIKKLEEQIQKISK